MRVVHRSLGQAVESGVLCCVVLSDGGPMKRKSSR